ncbi:MAG: thioredoxin-disulfide reductase [Candidatus Ancaeobacter aquaticus]|nr:thioredoxin-disulfide reductase [Candidatus Ancaeobacter aquaticus]
MTTSNDKYDVVIVGGGPGGLSAGIYGARGRYKTLLLEKDVPGGQLLLTNEVENYPGFEEMVAGPDLMKAMENQAVKQGLEIRREEVKEIVFNEGANIIKTNKAEYCSKTVIVATGSIPRKLGVPGEDALRGKGVSYCATCDGAFFRNKVLAVVGGGDSAVEEALYLTRFASKVYIIHRRDELRAAKTSQQRVFKNEKIEMVWDSVVEEIVGDKLVSNAIVKNVRSGQTNSLDINGVFIYVGTIPVTDFLKSYDIFDKDGHIVTDIFMETKYKGVFGVGDVRADSARQVASAVGDGVTALLKAANRLIEL